MSRDAKGKIDGVYFQSSTNVITNAGSKHLNLTIHQEINSFDQSQSAAINVSAGNPQSNTPSISAPGAKSIVKNEAARDTIIAINGVTTTQANTKPITVNGVTYNYFDSVTPGGSALTSTITIYDPHTISNSAIVSDPPLITGSPTTFSSNTPASSFSRQIASVATQSNASVIAGSGLNIDKYSSAQDARVTIGGMVYQRSSNVISDVIPKVTFTLMGGAGTANVNISWGQDNSEKAITDLSDAYNAVIKAYNTMTANSANSKTPGTFATSPTTLSFIENIKRRFATGATYNIGTNDANGSPYILSLASLGLDYQLDGTLKYNSISYLTSQANGLREKFLKGLRIGYVSATDNLMSFVKSQSGPGGALAQEMTIENNSINTLNKEQDNLQTRLNKIQDNYIAQYSGLNALLFQLNSTSTNLGNALTALNNMSASK
jgi:flagellar capping protein FliD